MVCPSAPKTAAIDPRNSEFHRGVIDEEPDFKIVGAVDDAIDLLRTATRYC